jgi:lipopolysaccharide transport system permease protein
LFFLVWRDVKVRYKQTILGFAWAVLQPLISAIIYTFIFGNAAGFRKYLPEGVPYLLFAFVGQIPWQFFATGMNTGGLSLVNQQHLLTKIYFPRLFLPTSAIGGALFDMLMSAIVLALFAVWYAFSGSQFDLPWTVVLVPLLIIPTAIAAMGMAYTLSALTVTYRDFRFIIPFMTQIWMLLSFVMFPRELLLNSPRLTQWEWVLSLNPMYGIIQAYRGLALGMDWNPIHLLNGTLVASALLVFGLFYFRKTERRFADIA